MLLSKRDDLQSHQFEEASGAGFNVDKRVMTIFEAFFENVSVKFYQGRPFEAVGIGDFAEIS